MSDQPTCPAAASHVVLSAIHPYPLSAHVPEVTTGYTTMCRPAPLLHELLEASQNNPVEVVSQSVVPHAQSALLGAVPFLMSQVGTGLQRLSFDVSQMSPVVNVQAPELPQTQGPALAVAPSLWVQAGPVKEPTMQRLKVLHRLPSE